MAAVGMPPHILALFQARKPLDAFPAFKSKHPRPYEGVADFVRKFESVPPPAVAPFETPKQRQIRKKRQKLLAHLQQQKRLVEEYKPLDDPKIEGDPFATLFVGKLSYETTEKKLKREFEVYGPIRRVRVVRDCEGKHRGYAFIEYERDRDMKEAYKKADGTKVDGRRVLVDVERARTVPGWLPRRLGGGTANASGPAVNEYHVKRGRACANMPAGGDVSRHVRQREEVVGGAGLGTMWIA
ncbi:RNA recognition motif-containing protein [Cyclospora cayetanensis]|uniref:RNA recognition motif-containing protein n=1 Tax=Cyclospora cayetanensis TaxID=88456 RepID=A0A1D3CX50_9EIME|nr:RNA recognition motif-containing protein [Cyclospora cayetanensis]